MLFYVFTNEKKCVNDMRGHLVSEMVSHHSQSSASNSFTLAENKLLQLYISDQIEFRAFYVWKDAIKAGYVIWRKIDRPLRKWEMKIMSYHKVRAFPQIAHVSIFEYARSARERWRAYCTTIKGVLCEVWSVILCSQWARGIIKQGQFRENAECREERKRIVGEAIEALCVE